jgi:hypothetical protein
MPAAAEDVEDFGTCPRFCPAVVLPYGRHRGEPLGRVPADYLAWLLANKKLSAGLAAAVAGELQARGFPVSAPAPAWSVRACPRCRPDPGFTCRWVKDRLGRRHCRAECRGCRRYLETPPSVPPCSDLADQADAAARQLDETDRS